MYKADAVDAPASSIALGRIVGPDVRVSILYVQQSASRNNIATQIGKVPLAIASSSKAPEPVSRKPTLKTPSEEVKTTESGRRQSDTPKLKTSGTLDWSKAKKAPETKKSERVKKEESPARKVKERTPTKSESESPKDNGKVRPAALDPRVLGTNLFRSSVALSGRPHLRQYPTLWRNRR